MSQSGTYGAGGGGGGALNTLTGNAGGPVGPDGGGNIDIVGAGGVTVTGNAGTNTLTITAGASNLTFNTDGTPAVSAGGVIEITGDGGNISTNGATNVVSLNFAASPDFPGTVTVGTALIVSPFGAGLVQSNGGGTLSSSNGGNGQVLIGGGAAPVWSNLTPGGGISITNAANSITISSTGGGLTWSTIAAGAQNLAVNNGYIANNAGGVTFTLPAAATVGSTIKITALSAGGFTIAQNAGQQIRFGVASTSVGVAGSLASTAANDSLEMVCVITNTTWMVLSAVGNFNLM